MNGPAQYLHFGFILISVANLIVISLMILIFVLAIVAKLQNKQRLSTLEDMPDPIVNENGLMEEEAVHS